MSAAALAPRRGFSLVELMIVVAIIGILAAIAIPNFMEMQLKSKRAELPGNIDGIKTAQFAHDAAFDQFVDATQSPAATPSGKKPVTWVDQGGFSTLGWSPDGRVRGTYVTHYDSFGVYFVVKGQIDVDGDGDLAEAFADNENNATLVTPNDVY